jgi:hypothetical protein
MSIRSEPACTTASRANSAVRWGLSLAVGMALSFSPSPSAGLEIVLENLDAPGIGLNDRTPVEPVGANDAATLGEQRWRAVQRGADVWREALGGAVPVMVHVTMAALPCGTLGASQSGGYVQNVTGPSDDRISSMALAESLRGVPINSDDEADINLELNGAECPDKGPTWYLGLDGEAPPGTYSLAASVAHELAHGLGFESLVNPFDGRALKEAPGLDPFSRLLFDTASQRYWHELSVAERRASAQQPRSVVWGGAHAQKAAQARLSAGSPVLQAMPPIRGFGGLVTLPAIIGPFERIEARLRSVLPADGCEAPSATAIEHVLLVAEGTCSPGRVAELAEAAGALAVLEVAETIQSPPSGFGRRELSSDAEPSIPIARIGPEDGALLAAASGVSAVLFLDLEQLSGADRKGRPFVYTPRPSALGASLSHWDATMSPSSLLEPMPAADVRDIDVSLERAVLLDIGWAEHGETRGSPDPAAFAKLSPRGGCSISTALARAGLSNWFSLAFLGLLVVGRFMAPKPS